MEVKMQIEEHTCATEGCGMPFWFTENFGDRRRKDKTTFYCPNGHSLSYTGETEEQKLKRITMEKNAEIVRLQTLVNTCEKKNRKLNRK